MEPLLRESRTIAPTVKLAAIRRAGGPGLWALALLVSVVRGEHGDRPNILFCLADDQSYPHASAYGEPVITTPVFDRVARDGVLFTQAYCASPSCTPSRSAILTGQDMWRLGQGGQLFGTGQRCQSTKSLRDGPLRGKEDRGGSRQALNDVLR